MYFHIWELFIFPVKNGSLTLYFTFLSLSFLIDKAEPNTPCSVHDKLVGWGSRDRMLWKVCHETKCACVVSHSPNTVLAGTDSLLSQNDTWERMTVMMQGRYVWITKYPIFLFKWKWAVITVYSPRRKI